MRARDAAPVLLALFVAGPAAAQTAFLDLGPGDTGSAGGLQLVLGGDGGDGESDVVTCGPPGSLRGSRRPRGTADNDAPDRFLHLAITLGSVKSASAVRIRATVHDDPALAGTRLGVQYSTALALDAGDLDNASFQHPFLHELAGSGNWVILEWRIRDAGFASLIGGAADFRLFALDPAGGIARPCFDRVEALVGAAASACPSGLSVAVDDETGEVSLSWTNNAVYARIRVLRDGRLAALLPGGAGSFSDFPGAGRFVYEVVALPSGDACALERLRGEARVFPSVNACGCPDPDANGDGSIDLQDIAIVTSNSGLAEGDPGYSHSADVDRSGAVDMADLELVLAHAGEPPPPRTVERSLSVHQSFGGVAEPGPLLRITSPHSRGSGRPEADPLSLLAHGRLLVASGATPSGSLHELDPAGGGTVPFPAAGKIDLNGDGALAGVTGLAFAGPEVWVSSRALPRGGRSVGSVAVLDRRTASPIAGPTGTGVFAGNEDAVDSGSPAALEETAGIAAGGAGADAPGASNRVHFTSNQRSGVGDGAERAPSIVTVDLDTGTSRLATLLPEEGVPGPLAFADGAPPVLLGPLGSAAIEAETGEIQGMGIATSPAGDGLATEDADDDARVHYEVYDLAGPAPPGVDPIHEYVVRIRGRLPDGTGHASIRIEAVEAESAVERRLRRGTLPGKLGPELRTVSLGRLRLRAGPAGNRVIVRFPEPGLELDRIEVEGPVGPRLYAATRDPGSIRIYALGVTGAPASPGTLWRGVLERVIGACAVEAGSGSNAVLDPVALEVAGSVLLVADAARSTVARIPLDEGGLEAGAADCYLARMQGQFLTGFASGPVGPGGFPGFYLATRALPGGGAGGAGGGGEGALSPSGAVSSAVAVHDIFFDRAASDIIRPLAIRDRRTLVVRASFSDGTTRDVTALASITSLDTGIVVLETPSRIKARAAAGAARLRAVFEGLQAETTVCVAPPPGLRSSVPAAHRARPPVLPGTVLRILPDRESYLDLFGVSVNALVLPVGVVQPFSAVLLDPEGRAAGLDVDWQAVSAAGNSIETDGDFIAAAAEAGGFGFPGEAEGLRIEAASGGKVNAEPISVFDPGAPPDAPPAALRIVTRDLRLLPGSAVRFVALLVDEDGLIRSFVPEWSSDGVPIDPATGLFTAAYRGETADESFTVVCRDAASGLSDSTRVTVLYSETSGIGAIPDAHAVHLAESFFDGALKAAIAAAGSQVDAFIEVTKENVGKKFVEGGVGDALDFIVGNVRCFFRFEYLGEYLFRLEEVKEFRLDPDRHVAVVTLKLRLGELLSARIEKFRVQVGVKIIPLLLGLLGISDPQAEESQDIGAGVTELGLRKLANSVAEVTAHLDLSHGEFSPMVRGTWVTDQDQEISRYLGDQFASVIGLQEGIEIIRQALTEKLVDLLLRPNGGILQVPVKFFCGVIGNIIDGIIPGLGQIVAKVCERQILNLVERLLRDAIDLAFEQVTIAQDLRERLREIIEEQVVQPTLVYLVDVLRRQDYLEQAARGYGAWTVVDDLARSASLRFAGLPPAGASLSLAGSVLPPELRTFAGVGGLAVPGGVEGYARFDHAGLISYSEESGIVLEGLGGASTSSGVPFDAANGLAVGAADLGISTNLGDVLSSLHRFGGTTAYRSGTSPRGAVSLRTSSASGAGDTVALEALSVSAPRFQLANAAPGTRSGSVHVVLKAVATGSLGYAVWGEASAPLRITTSGRTITIDIDPGAPVIRSPPAGPVPFAAEIRSLFIAAVPDLRQLVTGTLGGKLPITVEYPERVSIQRLGHLVTTLVSSETDDGFADDFIKASFLLDAGAGAEASALFRRGDCDADGAVVLSDALVVLSGLFEGGAPACGSACDADGSGAVDISDAVYLLAWMHTGGPPPPAPFPFCGLEREALDCAGGGHGCP